jgi:ATP-binding cassette subfamily C protein
MDIVFTVLKNALGFMNPKERFLLYAFLFARSIIAVFDLAGIVAFGYLAASVASLMTSVDTLQGVKIGSFTLPTLPAHDIPVFAVFILLMFLAKALTAISLTFFMARFLAKIEARAARVIAKNAFGKGLEGARLNSREEILFMVQAGSPSTFNTIPNALGILIAEGSLFFLVLVTFAVVDPVVALSAVCFFGGVGLLIQILIGSRVEKISKRVADATIDANTGLSDLGEVMREVTMTGRQDFFYDKIYKSRLSAASNGAQQVVLSSMPRYIIETSLIMAIAVFVVWQVMSGNFLSSISTLGIFLSGGLRLTASLLPLQAALLSIGIWG